MLWPIYFSESIEVISYLLHQASAFVISTVEEDSSLILKASLLFNDAFRLVQKRAAQSALNLLPAIQYKKKFIELKEQVRSFYWFTDNFTLMCPILGPLVPLFWISGDVSSGFQSQCGFCHICIVEANMMYIHSIISTYGTTDYQPLNSQYCGATIQTDTPLLTPSGLCTGVFCTTTALRRLVLRAESIQLHHNCWLVRVSLQSACENPKGPCNLPIYASFDIFQPIEIMYVKCWPTFLRNTWHTLGNSIVSWRFANSNFDLTF